MIVRAIADDFTQNSEPKIERSSLKNTPKSDHKSQSEIELERLEGKLRTVQLALEILTGVCATLPDPEFDAVPEEGEGDIPDDGEVLQFSSTGVATI